MNLLFVAKPNAENFIRNYTEFLPVNSLLVTDNPEQVFRREKHFDAVVYEWANDFTAKCIDFNKNKKPVFVRVHDHEVKNGRTKNIDWSRVKAAWFINKQVQANFLKLHPEVKSFYLPNAVSPTGLNFCNKKAKKIGLLSIYCRPRKRIDRAIELAKLLPDFEFVIRTDNGGSPECRFECERLVKMSESAPNVKWEFRPAEPFIFNGYGRKDVNDFFQDKAFVISTSEHEAFHYTVAEGALCGAIPVVYNWEFGGANDFWLNYCLDRVENMAKFIRLISTSEEESKIFHTQARQYVLDRFHPNVLIPELKKLINGFI